MGPSQSKIITVIIRSSGGDKQGSALDQGKIYNSKGPSEGERALGTLGKSDFTILDYLVLASFCLRPKD